MNEVGFARTGAVFTDAECAEVLAEIERASERRSRAGARHLLALPAVAALARDGRLAGWASRHLGDRAVPFRATLFDKSPGSNWQVVWHQDTALPLAERIDSPEWGPWSEKAGILYAHAPAWALERVVALRLHLDDSGEDNGPLRAIPGSHRWGVLADDVVFARAGSRGGVSLECPRGSILAMRPLLVHASSKARSARPRRVLPVEYSAGPDLAAGIRLAVA